MLSVPSGQSLPALWALCLELLRIKTRNPLTSSWPGPFPQPSADQLGFCQPSTEQMWSHPPYGLRHLNSQESPSWFPALSLTHCRLQSFPNPEAKDPLQCEKVSPNPHHKPVVLHTTQTKAPGDLAWTSLLSHHLPLLGSLRLATCPACFPPPTGMAILGPKCSSLNYSVSVLPSLAFTLKLPEHCV